MKKVFVILALLVCNAFAAIATTNSSGTTKTSFYTTDNMYAKAYPIYCRNTSNYNSAVLLTDTTVMWAIVQHRTWPTWETNGDQTITIGDTYKFASTSVGGSGEVPVFKLWGAPLTEGTYDILLITGGSGLYYKTNRQITVGPGVNCSDQVFPVVGGSPAYVTVSAPPIPCTGTVALTIPSTAQVASTVSYTVNGGFSNCGALTGGIDVYSCGSGIRMASFTPSSPSVSGTFTAPQTNNTFTYYACLDKNSDGDYTDSGEKASADLTAYFQPPCSGTMSMTLSPDTIIPASIVTANLTGFSGCNTPIYIKNGSCSGSTLQTFTGMPNGGTNTFIPLLGNGIYNIYACADFNGNTQYDVGEYASDTLTIGAGGQGCTGTIDLDLSASTAQLNQKIYYNISGYSNCGGRTVHLKKDSCAGPLVASYSAATEIYESSVGYQNYFNATSAGQFAHYACLDMNNDGDYDDAGEADSKSLTVDGGGDQTCDSAHCPSCTNSTSCSVANCQWTGSLCITPVTQCSSSACTSCGSWAPCTQNSCHWCNNACQSAQCNIGTGCALVNPSACTTEQTCTNIGAHWCNGICQTAECPANTVCSHDNCPACKKPGICSDENCYWYETSCHAQPPQNTGENFTIFISDSQIDLGGQAYGTVFGTPEEENKIIQIMKGTCNGTAVTNCTIVNGSCTFSFTDREPAGNYTYVACLDADGDGSYEKTTEAAPAPLIIREPAAIQDVLILLGVLGLGGVVGFLSIFTYSYKKKQGLLRQMQQQAPRQAEPMKRAPSKPTSKKKKK